MLAASLGRYERANVEMEYRIALNRHTALSRSVGFLQASYIGNTSMDREELTK